MVAGVRVKRLSLVASSLSGCLERSCHSWNGPSLRLRRGFVSNLFARRSRFWFVAFPKAAATKLNNKRKNKKTHQQQLNCEIFVEGFVKAKTPRHHTPLLVFSNEPKQYSLVFLQTVKSAVAILSQRKAKSIFMPQRKERHSVNTRCVECLKVFLKEENETQLNDLQRWEEKCHWTWREEEDVSWRGLPQFIGVFFLLSGRLKRTENIDWDALDLTSLAGNVHHDSVLFVSLGSRWPMGKFWPH